MYIALMDPLRCSVRFIFPGQVVDVVVFHCMMMEGGVGWRQQQHPLDNIT